MPRQNAVPAASDPRTWGVPAVALMALLLIWLTDTNQFLFLWINSLEVSTGTWAALTTFGNPLVALTLALPFCGRRPDLIRALIIAAIIATLTVHGFKELIGALRPAAVLAVEQFNIIGPELKTGSFPSGHTATVFTLTGILCLMNKSRLYWLLVPFALTVGLARCGVGAHWPADVMAGTIVGWLSAGAGIYLARYWQGGLSLTAQRLMAGVLMICALTLLFQWRGTLYTEAVWLERIIGLSGLVLGYSGLKKLIKAPPSAPG